MAASVLTKVGVHITTATTTTLVAGTAGRSIEIYTLLIYCDVGGVATNVTIQDSTPTNLVGTSVVFTLAVGASLTFPYKAAPYFALCAAGAGLQLVSSAAGPLEVYVEVAK